MRMKGSRVGHNVSRRTFLKQISCAPILFIPASFQSPLISRPQAVFSASTAHFPFADVQFVPHYPEKSPLDDVLRLAAPGSDEYIVEGYAAQIMALLAEWSRQLKIVPPGIATLQKFVSPLIEGTSLHPLQEKPLRSDSGLEVLRREFVSDSAVEHAKFLDELKSYFSTMAELETADFEIFSCTPAPDSPLTLDASIRYEFVAVGADHSRESRIGSWRTRWTSNDRGEWKISKWSVDRETVARSRQRLFVDVTSSALEGNRSYREQLLHGADYWRTVLDGAVGVDVYGNNGIAVGDFDNDGLDDIYVCQPAGLPNRLYRNCGDGTFKDVTESSGLGVLDFTACALFADFENRGLQDVLVVSATGPLLFINQGNGKFALKKDAFRFARAPQGSFTHAAIADYDRDGRLDVYFCLYSYYQGLDQYRYPAPYFDARNGPPNFLFRNLGNWTFEDRTEAAGLGVENDRYSFACSWGDINGDGWPDLYVVNDFGRNALYRNRGDGTFAAISSEARVNEAGAGMSACWVDFDNDGKQDIYAAGMWVPSGMRIFEDPSFHSGEPDSIRALYRRHMTGNSLYRNLRDGKFQNVGTDAGVEMGRWSWSTDPWDFDNDGYPDLYIANGYISGLEQRDVSSFFWRQVVARSPQDSIPSPQYERGWSAINELIRSDSTWNGHERNVFFGNNRDGTFSDISGIAGLDFRDDSRAFALADLDGDGRQEIVLKNRTAPQLRIMRNNMADAGHCIAFRLRGEKSNRDGIGTAVTVTSGTLRQTKYLQSGSGFLSQHTKELFFGLGKESGPVMASIRWPSGLTQEFEHLPINCRIDIRESVPEFNSNPFTSSPKAWMDQIDLPTGDVLPSVFGTWLLEPVAAPEFSLPDLDGKQHELRALKGQFALVHFGSTNSQAYREQLRKLSNAYVALKPRGVAVVAVNFDDTRTPQAARSSLGDTFPFPVLLANSEMGGIYDIIYRYLFDRHRDLSFPLSWLIDESGNIVKVYHGTHEAEDFIRDVAAVPRTAAERFRKALPFPGTFHQEPPQRNALTYGVAFFQHGFFDQAEGALLQATIAKPEDADAFYNLGTLYLRRNASQPAKQNLEQAIKLRPNYPEAWNNLGMLAAQRGDNEEAIRDFQRSLDLRPSYATALLNLGNLYRRQGDLARAETLLQRAHESEPQNPEVHYSLGMLFAHRNQTGAAEEQLKQAVQLRPNYSDALNNLGVLLVQQQRYSEAEADFRACIDAAPTFDQGYLNLARLYVVMNEKTKARSTLEALLQKQPEHRMAQQMLQLLY
jgi:Flp pilus assembly protein TadD/peroxiredoxin